jgi:hypothetical protein
VMMLDKSVGTRMEQVGIGGVPFSSPLSMKGTEEGLVERKGGKFPALASSVSHIMLEGGWSKRRRCSPYTVEECIA